jgi:hypothetical protein
MVPAPMCPHCKLPAVLLHQAKGDDARPSRTVFECKSCFRLITEPVSYPVKVAQ